MKRKSYLEQVAALPFRRDGAGGVDIMLVTSRDSKRWIIPKGWTAKGVKPHRCAAREAYEEAGLSGQVSKFAVGEFEYVKRLGRTAAAPCRVRVYYRGRGCKKCLGTGYSGRIPIYEIMTVTPAMAEGVENGLPATKLLHEVAGDARAPAGVVFAGSRGGARERTRPRAHPPGLRTVAEPSGAKISA